MRNPFKEIGGADDWFNKLWTVEIPESNDRLYGNAGTDMLYKSLCPKSPGLSDIIDRADKRFG